MIISLVLLMLTTPPTQTAIDSSLRIDQIQMQPDSFVYSLTEVYRVEGPTDSIRVAACDDSLEHVAVEVRQGSKSRVLYRGETGPEYDKIGPVTISPDGTRIAYTAEDSDDSYAIVDHVVAGEGAQVDLPIQFSTSGERVLWLGHSTSRRLQKLNERIHINDLEAGFEDIVGTHFPAFFPGSDSCAFLARRGNKRFLVIDTLPKRVFDRCPLGPIMSEEGNGLAYVGIKNDTAYAVVNGRRQKPYMKIFEFVFSGDGNRFAYTASYNFDHFVVTNDGRIGPYDSTWTPVLSHDGSHLAFGAKKDGRILLVRDSVEFDLSSAYGSEFSGAKCLSYSPQADKLALVVYADDSVSIVINDLVGQRWSAVGPVVFSPDGTEYAYGAAIGKDEHVVVHNGKCSPSFNSVTRPCFSGDSRNMAYTAVAPGGDALLIVNVQAVPAFMWHDPWDVSFDAGNRIVIFGTNDLKRIFKLTVSPAPSNE